MRTTELRFGRENLLNRPEELRCSSGIGGCSLTGCPRFMLPSSSGFGPLEALEGSCLPPRDCEACERMACCILLADIRE